MTAVGDYMFTVNAMDSLQGTVLATYAKNQGYENAYLLTSPDTDYTQMLPRFFAVVFEDKGGRIVVAKAPFPSASRTSAPEVTKIRNSSPAPDVIMTAGI